jgi:hypothetical protein
VPIGPGLYLGNVVFPSADDRTAGVLAGDAYLLLALMAAGVVARRVSGRRYAPVIAGVAAGLVLAVLGMATFAVIDNAFLSIVSHQQAKIVGLRASGMTSMRAYINSDLEAAAPGVAVMLAILGGSWRLSVSAWLMQRMRPVFASASADSGLAQRHRQTLPSCQAI